MYHIEAINAFDDNYIWIIHNNRQAILVDPGETAGADAFLAERKLELVGVLVTHWHPDHIGGIEELRRKYNIEVYGPDDEKIPNVDHTVNEACGVEVLGLSFKVIAVPGHTLEHVAYYNAEQQLLFCGDTLFSAGCGRMFEGNPAMYTNSLKKLKQLPLETRIFCAHEYTVANLAFAKAVEADNLDIQEAHQEAMKLREKSIPTIPTTLAKELKINPFLRLEKSSVIKSALANGAKSSDSQDVFAQLRDWKNNF